MTKPRKGTLNVPSVYVILRRKDKILFVLRKHTGFMDGTYSLPSGHVEDNESFITAAIRETQEEVGVKVARDNMRLMYTMHRLAENDVRVDAFFETDTWEGEPFNNEPHKHGDIAWFSTEELAKKSIMDYQGVVLQAIIKGKVYSEWGWPEDRAAILPHTQ